MLQCTKNLLLGQKAWAQTQLKISHSVYLYKCDWKSAKTFCWHKNGAYYFLLLSLKCSLLGNTAEGVYSACVSLCNNYLGLWDEARPFQNKDVNDTDHKKPDACLVLQ